MASQKVVTPVKTGVQSFLNYLKPLDSGFRRNDGCYDKNARTLYLYRCTARSTSRSVSFFLSDSRLS